MDSIEPSAHAQQQQPNPTAPPDNNVQMPESAVTATHESTHPEGSTFQRLLHTTELAEMVLGEMSLQDLLHMRQTCIRIRDLIKGSSPLQTQMFLRGMIRRVPDVWVVNEIQLQFKVFTGDTAQSHLAKTIPPNKSCYTVKPVVFNTQILSKPSGLKSATFLLASTICAAVRTTGFVTSTSNRSIQHRMLYAARCF